MRDDYAAHFLVGICTAMFSALFNYAVTGQVSGLWVLLAFLLPFVVLHLYQRFNISFRREWRVRANELTGRAGQPVGDGAWELDASERRDWAICGPYTPLGRGRYQARFRLKINNLAGDAAVVDIDVATRHGKKLLALRTLTARDFERADHYQEFPLDFFLWQDDNEMELRVSPRGARCRVVLERVTLARRLG